MSEDYDGTFDGKKCKASAPFRVRHSNRNWGWYNRVVVRFEDGTVTSMGLGTYNLKIKPLPATEKENSK